MKTKLFIIAVFILSVLQVHSKRIHLATNFGDLTINQLIQKLVPNFTVEKGLSDVGKDVNKVAQSMGEQLTKVEEILK
jgi:hypothetical protein